MIDIKDEGYIKFNIDHSIEEISISDPVFNEISQWRTKLFDLNLIGETKEGIGFGNISVRHKNGFFITGSATGKTRQLGKNGYAFVSGYFFNQNKIISKGMSKASSESMSHAAIYESREEINAVMHIHNKFMWEKYMDQIPTTSKEVAFGTPEMAFELKKLLKIKESKKEKIIVTGGHEDGIFTFGRDLYEAGKTLLKYFKSE